MTTHCPGISSLIARLEKIRADCSPDVDANGNPTGPNGGLGLGPNGDGSKPEKLDPFTDMKRKLLQMLHLLRNHLRERARIVQKHGNSYQAIEKGARAREMIRQIEQCLPKLQQLQMQGATGSQYGGGLGGLGRKNMGRGSNSKLSEEENQMRQEDVKNITRQLEEAKQALRSNSAATELLGKEHDNPDDADLEQLEIEMGNDPNAISSQNDANRQFRLQLESLGPSDKSGRGLNEQEADAIQRWQKRDERFDSMLDEIGVMCDRLNPLVKEIGVTVERQNMMGLELTKKVDETEVITKNLSNRMYGVIKTQKSSDFICKLILFLVLLCILGIVAQQVNNYY